MQEYKCVRVEACLGMTLEGLERLCKKKCNDPQAKKRNGNAQLWITNSHEPDDSELQSFFCLCDCESPNSWSTCTPSPVSPLPALDSCTCRIHTAISTTNAYGSPWKDMPNIPDNVNYLMNCSPNKQIVILYNDNILAKRFPDAFDRRDAAGITGLCLNNNIENAFKDIVSGENHSQREMVKEQTDSYIWDDGCTGKISGGIRRKSVSFADDVIVYLYDKDSPTEESCPESSSSLTSEILFDDNGLEWEDDFLALEKNCQSRSHPEPHRSISHLPTPNWTVNKPKSFVLSQSCLFLTHVNESDLEL